MLGGIVDFGKKPDWRLMLFCHFSGTTLSAARCPALSLHSLHIAQTLAVKGK